MATVPCTKCGIEYEVPDGALRLIPLYAKSGNLVVLGQEQVLHRCATLTSDDESMLLRDAGWVLDHPDEPPTNG
jgi:hypothetical protein